MYVYQVYIVDIEPFHTLVNAVGDTLCRIVPHVYAVLSVSSHLGGEIVTVALYFLQSFAENSLSLVVSVIGRNVDEVDAVIDCRVNRLYSFRLADVMENSSERGRPETEVGQFHAGLSEFIVYHSIMLIMLFNK